MLESTTRSEYSVACAGTTLSTAQTRHRAPFVLRLSSALLTMCIRICMYGTFAMIQDHPILNLLKTVRGRVRWVGHGRKPLETCLVWLGRGTGSVKTENRFHSNRRHHRRHSHHYSRRRRSSCRFHSWWLAKFSTLDKLKLLMGPLSAVHASVMTAEVYGHSQQQQRSQKCTAAG